MSASTRRPIDSVELQAIFEQFATQQRYHRGEPYGNGHINDTFAVYSDTGPNYILQRLNTHVFKKPVELMENVDRVCRHLQAQLADQPDADPTREAMTLVPDLTGRPYLLNEHGEYWRCYIFIALITSVDVVERAEQAYEAARAFGRFQALLADLPVPPLHETIVDFHHTPKRFAALQAAIAADSEGRAAACRAEIDYALSLGDMTTAITDGLASGELPLRVTHNDTKINNVLLDHRSQVGTCVIDLDTVMPGSALYDFGDLVRTATGHFAEDSEDLSTVYVDLERYAAVTSGYLSTAAAFLTPREIEMLPVGGLLMTYEVGIRFLTDYLQGDIYFRTHRPDQNLHRCRTQLAFVRDMLAHRADLDRCVATALAAV